MTRLHPTENGSTAISATSESNRGNTNSRAPTLGKQAQTTRPKEGRSVDAHKFNRSVNSDATAAQPKVRSAIQYVVDAFSDVSRSVPRLYPVHRPESSITDTV